MAFSGLAEHESNQNQLLIFVLRVISMKFLIIRLLLFEIIRLVIYFI